MSDRDLAAPEAVVFDFGGVLFNWQPLVLIQSVLPEHARDDAQAAALAQAVFQSFVPGSDWAEFDRGTLTWDEVSGRIAARTGLPQADVHRLMAAIPPHLVPVAGTVAWLERLAGAGTRLHFLSNMPAPYAQYLQQSHAFLGHFHSGVFSSEVQQVKPNEDIFHRRRAFRRRSGAHGVHRRPPAQCRSGARPGLARRAVQGCGAVRGRVAATGLAVSGRGAAEGGWEPTTLR